MMMFLPVLLLVMFLPLLMFPPAAGASTDAPPHILSILSDDLGYFDRSSAGNKAVSTPNLDSLFRSGVNLQRYYGYKYCSPTRRAFVTGRWPLHLGELNQLQDGIDLRMTTLAQKLALVGYHNVLIGKTHWGVKTTHHLPVNRGWHEHIGYLGGGEAYWSGHECVNETTNCNTFTTQLDFWHKARPAENTLLGEYSTTLFTLWPWRCYTTRAAVHASGCGCI
jgi:arylsulfatase A-like enzyme